jgi:hypothetical protein
MSYTATDLSKPKYFDDNLLISADTITEPTTKMNTTDLVEYFKDGRPETYITLTDTADHVFLYEFTAAQNLNFFELKGCNAHDYLVGVYVGASWETLMTGTLSATVDTALWYSVTTKSVTKIKITISHENYASVNSVIIADMIACAQIYEFVADARHYPKIMIDFSEEQNWLGAKRINKTRTWFECEVKVDGFTTEAQADLAFVYTLQQRNTPFYIWLNGNRTDSTFMSLGEAWKKNNIYRVYDNTKTLAQAHENGQNDTGNPTESETLKLTEAAYVEEAA